MATKIVCDGCGQDTGNSTSKVHSPAVLPPLGRPGDGLRRRLELGCGNNTVTMDLCITCYKRAGAWIKEAFPELARSSVNWWSGMCLDEESSNASPQ